MIYFWQNREELSCSLNSFYRAMGTSKQNFHQRLIRDKRQKEEVLIMIDELMKLYKVGKKPR